MAEYVLGINCYLHDTSAALLKGGRVVFAAAEERYSRQKKDRRFPQLAIRAALDFAGIGMADVDAVGFGWNRPGLTPLHTLRAALTGRVQPGPAFTLWSGIGLLRELYMGNGVRSLRRAFGPIERERIFHIDHHEAHAWSAYAPSGFDEALVLVLDGRGAWQSTTMYQARAGRLKRLWSANWPNSLGTFYEGFTDLLGFERANDEWKVMGLAAYGRPTVPMQGYIRTGPGGYQVNGRVLCGRYWNDISLLTERLGPRRSPESAIADADRDLAASVQKATEDAMLALVRQGVRRSGSRNLCLAGGVAMNSKANGKILASGLVENIFIQPAATDDGTAIGAALGVYAARGRDVPRHPMDDVHLGSAFSDEEIVQTLQAYKLPIVRSARPAQAAARFVAEGKIVGWFQGRMEFGPRALGNRSILADPRDPAMKDRVNASVKFREGWRPFAPSCLDERRAEYFAPDYPSPFMILTFDVNADKRDVIPAVTHVDNSARVQTVRRDVNPLYWELINEFDRLTGVPVVMNTSFNLRGEPIVCTPKDAIRTFYSSGLDVLVLGSYIVEKDGARSSRNAVNAESSPTMAHQLAHGTSYAHDAARTPVTR